MSFFTAPRAGDLRICLTTTGTGGHVMSEQVTLRALTGRTCIPMMSIIPAQPAFQSLIIACGLEACRVSVPGLFTVCALD